MRDDYSTVYAIRKDVQEDVITMIHPCGITSGGDAPLSDVAKDCCRDGMTANARGILYAWYSIAQRTLRKRQISGTFAESAMSTSRLMATAPITGVGFRSRQLLAQSP